MIGLKTVPDITTVSTPTEWLYELADKSNKVEISYEADREHNLDYFNEALLSDIEHIELKIS